MFCHSYVDFLNIMTYDMHGHWESQIGHHASLYPPAEDKTDSVVSYWRRPIEHRSLMAHSFLKKILKK